MMSRHDHGYVAIVDGNGLVCSNLERLRARFSSPISGQGLGEYVFRNMGYVRLAIHHRHVEVKLRPSMVAGPTLAAVLFWLSDRPKLRCTALIYDDAAGEWRHTILSTCEKAVLVLGAMVTEATAQDMRVIRRRSLEPHEACQFPPLGKAVEYWRQGNGKYETAGLERLLTTSLNARFILLRQDGGSLILSKVGSGLPKFALETLRPVVGRDFIHQPDMAHAKACIDAYTGAINLWEPVVEDVEAKAFWPGYGRLRRRYTRLIMPLRSPGNRVEVLSATMQSCPTFFERKAG